MQLDKFFCVQCGEQFRTRYPLKKLAIAGILACLSGSVAIFLYYQTRRPVVTIASTYASPIITPAVSPTSPALPQAIKSAERQPQPSPVVTRFASSPPTPTPTPLPFSPLRKVEPMLIASEPFTLHAKKYASYVVKVGVNQRHVRLVGEIKVRGGDQDIWVGVLTEQEFGNFQAGEPYGLVYATNLVGAQILNVPLSPGSYRVVMSNQHAQFLSKHVYPRLLMWFVGTE
ncbi:MAG: hypothetical protein ACKVZH_06710 [Blastocatellia bacterium]